MGRLHVAFGWWVLLGLFSWEPANASVLVIGGYGEEQTFLTTVELITEFGQRCSMPDLLLGRYGSVAENLNGTIFVCGGFTLEEPFTARSCEEFSIAHQEWNTSIPLNQGRAFLSSTVVQDTMVVMGGENSDGQIDSIEFLDYEAGYWMEGVSLPFRIEAACAVALNETVLVVSGGTGQSIYSSRVDMLDIITKQWTRLQDLKVPRLDHGCILTSVDGQDGILVSGGSTQNGATSSVEFLNLTSWTWEDFPRITTPRVGHEMVILGGVPTIIGGFNILESEQLINGTWTRNSEYSLLDERAWFSVASAGNLSCP